MGPAAHARPHGWTAALRSRAWGSASPQTAAQASGEGKGPTCPKAGAAGYGAALSPWDAQGQEHRQPLQPEGGGHTVAGQGTIRL